MNSEMMLNGALITLFACITYWNIKLVLILLGVYGLIVIFRGLIDDI